MMHYDAYALQLNYHKKGKRLCFVNGTRVYDAEYDETNVTEIKKLLLFHKVVSAHDDTLVLDNGAELIVRGNVGCCGCASGNYEVTELNGCENVITNVELMDAEVYDKYGEADRIYKIFVYAEDVKIKLLQVEGSDGNGYYGTGYTIYVKLPKTKETEEI